MYYTRLETDKYKAKLQQELEYSQSIDGELFEDLSLWFGDRKIFQSNVGDTNEILNPDFVDSNSDGLADDWIHVFTNEPTYSIVEEDGYRWQKVSYSPALSNYYDFNVGQVFTTENSWRYLKFKIKSNSVGARLQVRNSATNILHQVYIKGDESIEEVKLSISGLQVYFILRDWDASSYFQITDIEIINQENETEYTNGYIFEENANWISYIKDNYHDYKDEVREFIPSSFAYTVNNDEGFSGIEKPGLFICKYWRYSPTLYDGEERDRFSMQFIPNSFNKTFCGFITFNSFNVYNPIIYHGGGSATNTGYWINVYGSAGATTQTQFRCFFSGGVIGRITKTIDIPTGLRPTIGKRFFYSLVFKEDPDDDTNVKLTLYIDGIPIDDIVDIPKVYLTYILRVGECGAVSITSPYFIDGEYEDLMIFEDALSDERISKLYNYFTDLDKYKGVSYTEWFNVNQYKEYINREFNYTLPLTERLSEEIYNCNINDEYYFERIKQEEYNTKINY